MALALTALVFALAVRDLLRLDHKRGPLLPWDFVLHGWGLIVANVAFYGYLCWLGFCVIRGTAGRERAFAVGWLAAILLPPLELLRPEWAMAIRYMCVFGLAVSLLAVLALLLDFSVIVDPTDKNGAA